MNNLYYTNKKNMFQLDRNKAELLCSIITIGFMKKNNCNKYTDFICQEGDEGSHERLKKIITSLNSKNILKGVSFDYKIQRGKEYHPFIYSKRKQYTKADEKEPVAFTEDIMNKIDETVKNLTDEIEEKINAKHKNFDGAYIGGVIELKKDKEIVKEKEGEEVIKEFDSVEFRLLGPSMLDTYEKPLTIETDEGYFADAKVCFDISRVASKELYNIFLEGKLGDKTHIYEFKTSDGKDPNRIILYTMEIESFEEYQAKKWENELPQNHVFKSIHGLVISMIKASPELLYNKSFNVELALGSRTNKVASCMPCAIYATSLEAAPVYTHLGRGDFWNVPNNFLVDINHKSKKEKWIDFIKDCFEKGINEFNNLSEEMRAINEHISTNNNAKDLFLNALTFPGKFIDKLTNVLEKLDKEVKS